MLSMFFANEEMEFLRFDQIAGYCVSNFMLQMRSVLIGAELNESRDLFLIWRLGSNVSSLDNGHVSPACFVIPQLKC